jgi:hypothetical protein
MQPDEAEPASSDGNIVNVMNKSTHNPGDKSAVKVAQNWSFFDVGGLLDGKNNNGARVPNSMELRENLLARTSEKAKSPKSSSEEHNVQLQGLGGLLNSSSASRRDPPIDAPSGDGLAGMTFSVGTSSTPGLAVVNSTETATSATSNGGEVAVKEPENNVQAQKVVARVEMAVPTAAPIHRLGTSMPTRLETAATGLDSAINSDVNGLGYGPVVSATQNNAGTTDTEIVGDDDVDGLRDEGDHNPPQGDGIQPSSITNLQYTEILSAKHTSIPPFSVVDEKAAVEAFITLLSEQEVLGPLLKKVGYATIRSPDLRLRTWLRGYIVGLSRDPVGPLEKAAAQFLRDKRLEIIGGRYSSLLSRSMEAVSIETCLSQFSDFLVCTDAFRESTDDRHKTEDAGLSNSQRLIKFLFDGRAFRKLESRLTLQLEQPFERGTDELSIQLKRRILAKSDLKPVDVKIPKATATVKDNSTEILCVKLKQALLMKPESKPADIITQGDTSQGKETLKTAMSTEAKTALLLQGDHVPYNSSGVPV